MRGKFLGVLVSLTVLAAAGAASAQGVNWAENRKVRYRQLGAAFKTLVDQAKTGVFVRASAIPATRAISGMAHDQYRLFPKGSGQESGANTKVRAAVWSDAGAFRVAQDNFKREAAAMARAVNTGDLGTIRRQIPALGATCGECHRTFRDRAS